MRNGLGIGIALTAIVFLAIGVPAHALQSTFNSDAEGWTLANDASGPTWAVSGGNPGGYIYGTDLGDGRTWYFVSPASWNGNLSAYKGGTLSYDINLLYKSGGYFDNTEVIIRSGSSHVDWNPTTPHQPALNTWTTYSVELTYANFGGNQALFDSVMSNVTSIWIRGEYISGGDKEGVDNIIMTAPVPIPGAMFLLAPGLAGIAAVRRRLRK